MVADVKGLWDFFSAAAGGCRNTACYSAHTFDGSARRSLHRATAIDFTMPNFAEILIRKRVISQDQLAEAKKLSKESRKSVAEELIRLGYANGDEVMRAMAQEHGLDFVNLNEVVIPPSIVELVPESVARENAVLPLAEQDGTLKVIMSDPNDYDTREKLRFILNRNIEWRWRRENRF